MADHVGARIGRAPRRERGASKIWICETCVLVSTRVKSSHFINYRKERRAKKKRAAAGDAAVEPDGDAQDE